MEQQHVGVELEQLSDEVLMSYCEDCNLMDYYNEYEEILLFNM